MNKPPLRSPILLFLNSAYLIAFATLLITYHPARLLADDTTHCSHQSPEEIARVRSLRETMAVIDLAVGPEDASTEFGLGVIDSSCLTGAHTPYRAATIRALRTALQRTAEQAARCQQRLGIIEMPDIISVLSQTRYFCQPPTGDGVVASMRRTYRTYDSCGRGLTRFMAGAYRRYHMDITAPTEGLRPKINATASTALEVDELASFLAHEAMHVLSMNNRAWHNNFDPEQRTSTACQSSLFEDRIYFTQAACFPDSDYGRAFYAENGPSQCPGLCETALAGMDPEAPALYGASTAPGAERTGASGPSQVARPYTNPELALVCARIRGRAILGSQTPSATAH